MPDFRELFAFCDLHASRRSRDPYRLLEEAQAPRFFDRQGFPIPADGDTPPVLRMAQLMEQPGYRCVALDEFPDGSYLDTSWLGLDHGFFGPPLLFETMYFTGELETIVLPGGAEIASSPAAAFPDPEGELGAVTEQLRYRTEEEALAMHHEIARRIRKRWEV